MYSLYITAECPIPLPLERVIDVFLSKCIYILMLHQNNLLSSYQYDNDIIEINIEHYTHSIIVVIFAIYIYITPSLTLSTKIQMVTYLKVISIH